VPLPSIIDTEKAQRLVEHLARKPSAGTWEEVISYMRDNPKMMMRMLGGPPMRPHRELSA
jgi:hypothetical protein